MRLNLNNDISIYRGETAALDFKISQRSDYYVPFLISSARVNPMVCITIGSTRRESNNIVSKQLWLDLDELLIPRFTQTTVSDLGILSAASEDTISQDMTAGIMYQFRRESEVAAGNPTLHFAYIDDNDVVLIDDYEFTIVMSLDEDISLDMTNIDYYYQIELMDTEPMIDNLVAFFTAHPELVYKLPSGFDTDPEGIANSISTYLEQCINLVLETYPTYFGHRITNPLTSPVASVSNIQIIQPPRKFTVQSVVK